MRTIIWFSVLVFCFVLLSPAYPAQTEDTSQLQAKIADLEKRVSDLEKLLQPMRAQMEQKARQSSLREKFIKRLEKDRQNHTQEQMSEAEKLYQVGNSKWGTPEAIDSLISSLQID